MRRWARRTECRLHGIDYDEGLHRDYVSGRAQSAATRRLWIDAVAAHLPPDTVLLDVGCGAGRFASAFAEELRVRVVGVDPSRRMLRQARPHPRVAYLRGEAERLPLRDATANFAFLSMVLHHCRNLDAVCRELGRVLERGARVFVRNSYADRLDDEAFYRFFVEAKPIDAARIPTRDRVVVAFATAGFDLFEEREIEQCLDASLLEHAARLRRRPYSSFGLMSEDEIRRGYLRLEAAVRAEIEPTPVFDRLHVLLFERA